VSCGVTLSSPKRKLDRPCSIASGAPRSRLPFDALERNIMGSEVSGLIGRVTQLLEAAGIPFMVAGSFASTAHGLPRTTQDLDLIIDPPSAAEFEALLASTPADQYYVDADTARDALRRRSMFNLIDLASGWKIDLILRKDRPFSRDEFARRMKMTILGVSVFVASPEDTIVAKLEWSKQSGGSERQRRDVAGVLANAGEALDRVYIERWVRDLDLDDEWKAAQSTPI
jgi:hypothetical protein